jgi:uncharacterized protein (TIGR03086 family)
MSGVTDADITADLSQALAATATVVAGIGPGQWTAPTPCTELDVRAVLNHLVRGNLLFVAIVRGEQWPAPGTDHLGDAPLAAYEQAAAGLREVFAAPGVLEQEYTAPFGTGTGAGLVHVRIIEVLAHGWDLARATGQAVTGFPEDVAERAVGRSRRQLTARPEGPGAPFAPEVPVPDDAPAVDRLAGFLGRRV